MSEYILIDVINTVWVKCKALTCVMCPLLGLPDRLPDTVRPAAVLQYVLRSPQQRRETNPAVYRSLAPPPVCLSATPRHHLPSTVPWNPPLSPHHLTLLWRIYNPAKETKKTFLGCWSWQRERTGCTLPRTPLFVHTCDGIWRTLQRSKWGGERLHRRSEDSPFWSHFRLGKRIEKESWGFTVGQVNHEITNGLFCHVLFVT